ncbi:MAG: serine hydrolase domain-containing protein [Candidatus Nanopelagicales bacterium]
MRLPQRITRVGAVAILLAGTGALAACGSSSSSGGSSQPPLAGEAQLRSAMTALSANGGPPGVMTIVQQGSQVYELAEGKADITSGQAMSGGATTRIASVSKPFSGAILLTLASQGKLALSSTLAQALPSAPPAWGKATLAQVLQHTSGLPDYIKSPKFLKEFIANPKMERTPQQLIGYVANKPLDFKPGSQYGYSDTDNIVAGLVAEHVLAKPYSEILKDLVTAPMQLSNTSLPSTTALPSGFIHGYDVNPPAIPEGTPAPPEDVSELINPGLAWASGGMISTANDLNTFIRGFVSGKLFNPQVLTDPAGFVPGAGGPPGPGTNSSGLSIYRYETACGTVFGHTGNMPGYTAFVGSTADGSNSVVVVVNSQITPKGNDAVFNRLLAVENQAICSANGQTGPSASASG